ncbi:polysaccharide deacetylase family protein [Kitasatospora sp. SUK 42]|uniref:polysaccharide deacetylase family protein n=1 Tax=Kitasatospora sp. SUK 42 TaxID=1588882 RepID=UPI0018CA51DF|nr:polysaccharide deacetylase family protein [Kitasatospora sp. SUK 42]MBV2153076.1 polysaccharide deacetylase family protein [Kitasatospora sp. SUK 42]
MPRSSRRARPLRPMAGAVAALLATGLGLATLASAGATSPAADPKVVYLTFDDGPSPQYTAQILAVLARYRVPATFFEIGQNVTANPGLTDQAVHQGESVQNHSWDHPDLRPLSLADFNAQILNTDQAIRARTGRTPTCLRPPYGFVDKTVRARAAALGKTIKLWTVDPADWSRPGIHTIEQRVLTAVRPGSVILLHDGGGDRSQTVAALPTVLTTLQHRGYTFRLLCH